MSSRPKRNKLLIVYPVRAEGCKVVDARGFRFAQTNAEYPGGYEGCLRAQEIASAMNAAEAARQPITVEDILAVRDAVLDDEQGTN